MENSETITKDDEYAVLYERDVEKGELFFLESNEEDERRSTAVLPESTGEPWGKYCEDNDDETAKMDGTRREEDGSGESQESKDSIGREEKNNGSFTIRVGAVEEADERDNERGEYRGDGRNVTSQQEDEASELGGTDRGYDERDSHRAETRNAHPTSGTSTVGSRDAVSNGQSGSKMGTSVYTSGTETTPVNNSFFTPMGSIPSPVSAPISNNLSTGILHSATHSSSILPVYGCRRVKDVVFASSVILARLKFDVVKNMGVMQSVIGGYSQEASVLVCEYMDEIEAWKTHGRQPYPMDPMIFQIESSITSILKEMDTLYPTQDPSLWNDRMEVLDKLYIELFDRVQRHPRVKNPGGVHHMQLLEKTEKKQSSLSSEIPISPMSPMSPARLDPFKPSNPQSPKKRGQKYTSQAPTKKF